MQTYRLLPFIFPLLASHLSAHSKPPERGVSSDYSRAQAAKGALVDSQVAQRPTSVLVNDLLCGLSSPEEDYGRVAELGREARRRFRRGEREAFLSVLAQRAPSAWERSDLSLLQILWPVLSASERSRLLPSVLSRDLRTTRPESILEHLALLELVAEAALGAGWSGETACSDLVSMASDARSDARIQGAALKCAKRLSCAGMATLIAEMLSIEAESMGSGRVPDADGSSVLGVLARMAADLRLVDAVGPLSEILDRTDDEYHFASVALSLARLGGPTARASLARNGARYAGGFIPIAANEMSVELLEGLESSNDETVLESLELASHLFREQDRAIVRVALLRLLQGTHSTELSAEAATVAMQVLSRDEVRGMFERSPRLAGEQPLAALWKWASGTVLHSKTSAHPVQLPQDTGIATNTQGISPHTFGVDRQEYGDPGYRENKLPTSGLQSLGHTGLHAGVDSNHSARILEVPGPGSFVVRHNLWSGMEGDEDYWGSQTLNNAQFYMTFARRRAVMQTAFILMANDISYPPLGLDALTTTAGAGASISPGEIETLRCDGLVEYAYEYNGLAVWGPSATNYDISSAAALPAHNELYEDVVDPFDPNAELAPVVQSGRAGGFSTRMTWASQSDLPTYGPAIVSHAGGIATVTLSATDRSGIHYIGAKVGSGAWSYSPTQSQHPPVESYTWQFSFPNSACTTVYFFAMDGGANAPENSESVAVCPPTGLYALTVSGTGAGSGRISGSGIDCTINSGASTGVCSKSLAQGSNVTLTAAPAGSSVFGGWSGACSGGGVCSFSMTGNKSVSGAFSSGAPSQTGSVTVNATLNGAPWPSSGSGTLSAGIVGPAGFEALISSVPQTLNGPAGNWSVFFSSGGPTGEPPVDSPVEGFLASGGALTLTLAFGDECRLMGSPVACPCTNYHISPTSRSPSASAGSRTVTVSADPPGCSVGNWQASGNGSWLTASRTSSTSAEVAWAANSGGARSATAVIAGRTFSVNQAAATQTCSSYTIDPTYRAAGSAAGSQQVNVLGIPAGCTFGGWGWGSNEPWLSASQTGASVLTIQWTENFGFPRVGTVDIQGNTFTVSQAGLLQACSAYSIAPTSLTPGAAAGGQSILVTGIPAGCTSTGWSLSWEVPWLSISYSGVNSVCVSWEVNPSSVVRTGFALIAGNLLTVAQSPEPCTSYSITPEAWSAGRYSSYLFVEVEGIPQNCAATPWGVSSADSWLNVTALYPGTARVDWSENSGPARTGIATIAGKVFTLSQEGVRPDCTSVSISPASYNASASAGSLVVDFLGMPPGCAMVNFGWGWSAPWLHVDPVIDSGLLVSLLVLWLENTGLPRTATATIEGNTFTLNQAGATQICEGYSINPASVSASAIAGSQSVAITGTPAGCVPGGFFVGWNAPWLTGRLISIDIAEVSWAANSGPGRMATVEIAGNTFVVNQAGVVQPCASYSINPASVSASAAAGSQSVSIVGFPAGCTMVVDNGWNVSWLTVASPTVGIALVSWQPNLGAQRSTVAFINGNPFTVNQAAGSGSGGDIQLSNDIAYSGSISGVTSQSAWQYYFIEVPAGATYLEVVLDGLSDDVDLYVNHSVKPSLGVWACRPFEGWDTAETCRMVVPAPGTWWIGVNNYATGTIGYRVRASVVLSTPGSLFTVVPCRTVDTRSNANGISGGLIQGNESRCFSVANICGVPSDARAVAANVTVINAAAQGELAAVPFGAAFSSASAISFGPGGARANNAMISLSPFGVTFCIYNRSVGSLDLVVDVTGFFR